MKYERPPLDRCRIEAETGFANNYAQKARLRVEYLDGKERAERLTDCTCPICYKAVRVAGAACSSAPCGICRSEVQSNCTRVDVLCRMCARRAGLCRACGADIDLKIRRKGWNLKLPGEVGDGAD